MMAWAAAVSCLLGVVPALLFIRNLANYTHPPAPVGATNAGCSVLIPARNEEAKIASSVLSALRNSGVELEVLVLDDNSTDGTTRVVQEIADCDPRVRLIRGSPLPPGWCGKQYACYQLARAARYSWLVFVDADVRLAPDALARMCAFMEQTGAALASGLPRQETNTFSERLLVPLIHFVLLGFLPIDRMRATCAKAYSAGCGQLFVAQRAAYHACGGHSAIPATLHDGLKLPSVFRSSGFRTDLFDATGIAVCRMYWNNLDVWHGFAKNAHEALGSSMLVVPVTLLLLGGQVLPPLLAVANLRFPSSPITVWFSVIGTIAAFFPRLLAVKRFQQPLSGALFHPIAMCGLVATQWFAFFRSFLRQPTSWKGRLYSTRPPVKQRLHE